MNDDALHWFNQSVSYKPNYRKLNEIRDRKLKYSLIHKYNEPNFVSKNLYEIIIH